MVAENTGPVTVTIQVTNIILHRGFVERRTREYFFGKLAAISPAFIGVPAHHTLHGSCWKIIYSLAVHFDVNVEVPTFFSPSRFTSQGKSQLIS
jgi:hypothetical protein